MKAPLFTPSTKADLGAHDENITLADAKSRIGDGLLKKSEDCPWPSIPGAGIWLPRARIIIADTKFEFGLDGKDILLIDEVMTPDSSRFWPAALYTPGKTQPSFDKQYLRDWLSATGWDKTPPASGIARRSHRRNTKEIPGSIRTADRLPAIAVGATITGEYPCSFKGKRP